MPVAARTSRLVFAAAVAALLAVPGAAGANEPRRPRRGPAKVVEVINDIAQSLTASRYQHVTRVRAKRGEYFFDCSGMAGWILKRSAPMALRVVPRNEGGRPLAVHFFKRIKRVPLGERRGPWYRPADLTEVEPGDVIAWKRPPWFRSKSTGHVAFVMSKGTPNPGPVPGYLFWVADASRFRHEHDTRAEGQTGFGMGVMLLATNGAPQPAAYGWYGSVSHPDWVVPADIVVGRPLR